MNLSPLAAATDTTAPATGAAPGSADAESAFDNILALETLAAAAPQFDASLEDITVQEDDTTEAGVATGPDDGATRWRHVRGSNGRERRPGWQ
jgi:hypothetical protein